MTRSAIARRALAALLFLLPLLGCDAEAPSGERPERIVALAPNLVEILFALGLGDRVVGVGDYVDWPPEAASRPRLGGLFDANLEKVVALAPDLAVLLPSQRDLAAKLERLGVGTLVVPIESLADVERSFVTIGRRAGAEAEGRRLAARFREALAPRPVVPAGGEPLRAMVTVGREPGRLADVLAAGPGTFYQELLERLGAANAFADAPSAYPQVGLEEVIARAPQVIFELRPEPPAPEVLRQLQEDWQRLPRLRTAHVAVLSGSHAVTPGPRLPELYQDLERELRLALAARSEGR